MGYYSGMVKVVNADKMCFPADPVTLEPKRCSLYDTHPWDEPDAHEIIGAGEWNSRRSAMREMERVKTPNTELSGARDGA